MSLKNGTRLASTIVLLVVVMACSSAVPTETPGVERLGQYILREKVPNAEVVLGYKWADSAIGNEWLILELAMTSPKGTSAKFERENIWAVSYTHLTLPTN